MSQIDPDESARRRAAVESARHSTKLEGGRSDAEVHAIQERWVSGEIELDQLDALILAAHPTTAPQ
jgi:hypothetical protein